MVRPEVERRDVCYCHPSVRRSVQTFFSFGPPIIIIIIIGDVSLVVAACNVFRPVISPSVTCEKGIADKERTRTDQWHTRRDGEK